MSQRIDTYLAELAQHLRGKISDTVIEQRISELRGHLHLSQQDLQQQGLDEDAAERRALQNLGAAKTVAGDMLLQARGYTGRSAWSLSLFPMLLVPVTFALFFLAALKGPSTADTMYLLAKLSALPVLLAFTWQVLKTRRWLVAPVVVAFAATYVITILIFDIGHRTFQSGTSIAVARSGHYAEYRDNLSAQLLRVRGLIKESEKLYKSVQSGGHTPMGTIGPLVPNTNTVYRSAMVPGTLWPASSRVGVFHFVSATPNIGQEEADRRWREDGAITLQDMRREESDLTAALATWRSGPAVTWDHVWISYGLPLVTIAIHGLLLAALNWLLIGMLNLRRRLANRRDPIVNG